MCRNPDGGGCGSCIPGLAGHGPGCTHTWSMLLTGRLICVYTFSLESRCEYSDRTGARCGSVPAGKEWGKTAMVFTSPHVWYKRASPAHVFVSDSCCQRGIICTGASSQPCSVLHHALWVRTKIDSPPHFIDVVANLNVPSSIYPRETPNMHRAAMWFSGTASVVAG